MAKKKVEKVDLNPKVRELMQKSKIPAREIVPYLRNESNRPGEIGKLGITVRTFFGRLSRKTLSTEEITEIRKAIKQAKQARKLVDDAKQG